MFFNFFTLEKLQKLKKFTKENGEGKENQTNRNGLLSVKNIPALYIIPKSQKKGRKSPFCENGTDSFSRFVPLETQYVIFAPAPRDTISCVFPFSWLPIGITKVIFPIRLRRSSFPDPKINNNKKLLSYLRGGRLCCCILCNTM